MTPRHLLPGLLSPFFLGAALLVVLSTANARAQDEDEPPSAYPPLLDKSVPFSPPTPEQKRWALATCAVLTESNADDHGLLGGGIRTPYAVVEREFIAKWWGIRSHDDALRVLGGLESGGHRREFDEMAQLLSNAPAAQLETVKRSLPMDAAFSNRVSVVLEYKERFGSKGIAAWDLSRYVAVCGWSYVAGYLTEEEVWRYIMPVARTLQRTFSSWKELGENCVVGRRFWSYQRFLAEGHDIERCYQVLLHASYSPWTQIPWDLDLSPPGTKPPER